MSLKTVLKFCFCLRFVVNPMIFGWPIFGFTDIPLVTHVEESIWKAEKGLSQLNTSVLEIEGMSSAKIRHFLNNLCTWPDAVYLEVGCYKGSTLISALYQNPHVNAIGIDNWSQFDGTKEILDLYLARLVPQALLRFYEVDAFDTDPTQLSSHPITVYFYDGNHDRSSQKKAFTHFNAAFDSLFVAIIDDWNWSCTREATLSAFEELGYRILYKREFYTDKNGDSESWWNGICIAVIEKS